MGDKIIRISDPLKEEVDRHEHRLQQVAHRLLHANTHISALTDLAQRLRFHLEVKKPRDVQRVSHRYEDIPADEVKKPREVKEMKNDTQVKEMKNDTQVEEMENVTQVEEMKNGTQVEESLLSPEEVKTSEGEVKKARKEKETSDNPKEMNPRKGELEEEDLYFKFPAEGPTLDREFLKMVESLVEGIILVGAETNLGKIARELQGSLIQDDLQKWRHLITILQKFDDQVRRTIEFFDRQQTE